VIFELRQIVRHSKLLIDVKNPNSGLMSPQDTNPAIFCRKRLLLVEVPIYHFAFNL
jgi:hypothetical protein